MFSPDDYYISLSRSAGEDLRALGVLRTDQDGDTAFQEFRKVLISGISDGMEVGERELHLVVSVNMFGEDLGLWCVIKNGSPAGIQDKTLTVLGVVSHDDLFGVFMNKGKNKDYLYKLYAKHAPHLVV